MPSVAERQQVLRERIEPQRLQLERERFDLERWRSQEQVKQGWKRIEQAQQGIALSAQRLAQSLARQNWQQAQDAIKNLSIYQSQLAKEEDSITRQLNAHTKDELGRPVPVYNIPPQRQQQLLAGATPTSPLEAQWQDLKMRLAAVRRERQRAAQLLQNAVLPPSAQPNPSPKPATPVFKTRSGNIFTP